MSRQPAPKLQKNFRFFHAIGIDIEKFFGIHFSSISEEKI
jgi:hypothetical protein